MTPFYPDPADDGPRAPAPIDEHVRALVQQELAALGGHLLATYHGDPAPGAGDGRTYEPELATLGGYLTRTYGQPSTEELAP